MENFIFCAVWDYKNDYIIEKKPSESEMYFVCLFGNYGLMNDDKEQFKLHSRQIHAQS